MPRARRTYRFPRRVSNLNGARRMRVFNSAGPLRASRERMRGTGARTGARESDAGSDEPDVKKRSTIEHAMEYHGKRCHESFPMGERVTAR